MARRIGFIPPGHRLTAFAFAVLAGIALVCAYQVASGLLGGDILVGAAGRVVWIRWPNVPDLFMRAMLFYGLGLVVSGGCAAVLGLGLVDGIRHDRDESRN